jgi:hypothetical protein
MNGSARRAEARQLSSTTLSALAQVDAGAGALELPAERDREFLLRAPPNPAAPAVSELRSLLRHSRSRPMWHLALEAGERIYHVENCRQRFRRDTDTPGRDSKAA